MFEINRIFKYLLLICSIFQHTLVPAQNRFDSASVEKLLSGPTVKPERSSQDSIITMTIATIDNNYRSIADTLFNYKSKKYTIFRPFEIELDGGKVFDPLSPDSRISTKNFLFYNPSLALLIDSIAAPLIPTEKTKLYEFLANNYDNFSVDTKTFSFRPVQIRYIRKASSSLVVAGIDIYGNHYGWSIDCTKNWKVVRVEKLWTY